MNTNLARFQETIYRGIINLIKIFFATGDPETALKKGTHDVVSYKHACLYKKYPV
jgi:hypothetical protein